MDGGPGACVDAARPLADVDLDVIADDLPDVLRAQDCGEYSDHRVLADVIGLVTRRLPGKVLLRDVAVAVSSTPSAVSRLFTRETGANFATYVRWAIFMRALDGIVRGQSITGAARDAMFADSSHAARVCREMAGVPPSVLLRATQNQKPFDDARTHRNVTSQ